MSVPLFNLTRQNDALRPALEETFARILASGHFIMGPDVSALEAECAAYAGIEPEQVIGVSSGTDALLLALMTAGIGPGDEVILPSFTFFATAGCVARVGATPVFVDSCPVCFNLDPDAVMSAITPRTKAIIPVHLFGQCAEMDRLLAVASERGLTVIEDAAQAFGARYRGQPAGTMGDFGAFSFFPTKNLGGFGDGGLLFVKDPEVAQRARILRVHGGQPKYYHALIGGNFRLDSVQAGLIRVKLPHYDDYTRARQENASFYLDQLGPEKGFILSGLDDCTCPVEGPGAPAREGASRTITLPCAYPHNTHIWNQFTLLVDGPGADDGSLRNALRSFLQDREIGSEIYYPVPLHAQECFPPAPGEIRPALPVAESLSRRCLSIPIFPELSTTEKEEVVAALRAWVGETA